MAKDFSRLSFEIKINIHTTFLCVINKTYKLIFRLRFYFIDILLSENSIIATITITSIIVMYFLHSRVKVCSLYEI